MKIDYSVRVEHQLLTPAAQEAAKAIIDGFETEVRKLGERARTALIALAMSEFEASVAALTQAPPQIPESPPPP